MKESEQELEIDVQTIKLAALKLRALNNRFRWKIITLLSGYETMVVTDIYKKLKFEQSVTSQHLAILRKSNYVIAKREGKFIYYSVNRKEIKRIMSLLESLIGAKKI